MSDLLQEVTQELEKSRVDPTSISRDRVENWMEAADNDPDVLGAIYVFLSKVRHSQRVKPPLSFDPVFNFVLRYYEFCLKFNPESEWANSRYSAGSDLVGWFIWMWDEKREKKYFAAIKLTLEKLYITGDAEMQKCIVHAVIDHLFERKTVRAFFADWKCNPKLRAAYDDGMVWVNGCGKSPLTEHRQRSSK
jgi:hypothetical protein